MGKQRQSLPLRQGCPPLIFRQTNKGFVNTKIDSYEQAQIYARVVRANSAALLVYLWHIFQGKNELVWDLDIDIQTYTLDRIVAGDFEDPRCSVRVAPRRLKTTIFSLIFNVFGWMNHPSKHLMYLTYGKDLLKKQVDDLRLIIRHEHFEWLQRAIKEYDPEYDIFELQEGSNNQSIVANTLGGSRISGKTGESEIAGATAHWLVIDDALNAKVMYNDETPEVVNMLLTTRARYDNLWKTRVVPGGFKLSIGHKMAEGDLQDYLIKDKAFPVVSLPLVYMDNLEYLSALDPRTENGQMLHNNMHTRFPNDLKERMEKLEVFWKLHQHSVYISNNVMFPVSSWRIKHLKDTAEVFMNKLLTWGGLLFNVWDHASTVNINSKFTCRVRMVLYRGVFYIFDVKKYKLMYNDMEIDFIADCNEYPESINVVENADNGRSLYQRYNPTAAPVWDNFNNKLRLISISTTGVSKKQRATFTASLNRSHKLFLIQADWNVSFVSEHLVFSTFTDQIDACSLGLWAIMTNRIDTDILGNVLDASELVDENSLVVVGDNQNNQKLKYTMEESSGQNQNNPLRDFLFDNRYS